MAVYAYTEIKGTMEGKMKRSYHYALDVTDVAMWQFYPSTTLVRRLFFAAAQTLREAMAMASAATDDAHARAARAMAVTGG